MEKKEKYLWSIVSKESNKRFFIAMLSGTDLKWGGVVVCRSIGALLESQRLILWRGCNYFGNCGVSIWFWERGVILLLDTKKITGWSIDTRSDPRDVHKVSTPSCSQLCTSSIGAFLEFYRLILRRGPNFFGDLFDFEKEGQAWCLKQRRR